jgi:hypothetical protein
MDMLKSGNILGPLLHESSQERPPAWRSGNHRWVAKELHLRPTSGHPCCSRGAFVNRVVGCHSRQSQDSPASKRERCVGYGLRMASAVGGLPPG